MDENFIGIITNDKELDSNRVCALLRSEDKQCRKRVLREILIIVNSQNSRGLRISEIWEIVNKPLAKTLYDPAESCRYVTVQILEEFLKVLEPSEKHIIYIVPVLARRLGSQELNEPSEEVRLICVSLLKVIISRYMEFLHLYIDDFINILIQTVTDNYPKVKRESCECISDLAEAVPQEFYCRSVALVNPILSNFKHQHFTVRAAAVTTIGNVLQYGDSKSILDVASPLAERLFDRSYVVREAVIKVVGSWLIQLKDRYSWWAKLLPLILTGLHDENEETRKNAATLWDAVGEQYLKENTNDEKLKDQMDYLTENPKHYPPNIMRPNLGCRVLAQQNFCKLVNGIGNELRDWVCDIRVRSAQLLCVFLLHIEKGIVQSIENILPAMYCAANDSDSRVCDNVTIAAEYIGYFVPPDVYCNLILPTIEESPSIGNLRVLANIFKGSDRLSLCHYLKIIGEYLQRPHICQSRNVLYGREILNCCSCLISVCKEDCRVVSKELFTVIFTVLSLCEELLNKANELLNELSVIDECPNLDTFYIKHLKSLLIFLRDNCKSWTLSTPESLIFRACFVHAGISTAVHMDSVFPILISTMNIETDPELRLKHFIILTEYFARDRLIFLQINKLEKFAKTILEECILPNLVWVAGKVEEVLRTAAVCCLCALLQNNRVSAFENTNENSSLGRRENANVVNLKMFPTCDSFSHLFEKITPILVSLANDNPIKTRLYSLKAIYLMMNIGNNLNCIVALHINQMYPVVLKRLDDSCNDVRCAAVAAIVEMWQILPCDYDLVCYQSHIDLIYTTMIVHLDDPEENFQRLMLDAFMKITHIHPELLYRKLHKCKYNFRNQMGIDKLISHCREILSNRVTMK